MVQERMGAKAQRAGNPYGGSLGLGPLKGYGPVFGLDFGNAFQVGQKVQVPVAAAEFAVGNGL